MSMEREESTMKHTFVGMLVSLVAGSGACGPTVVTAGGDESTGTIESSTTDDSTPSTSTTSTTGATPGSTGTTSADEIGDDTGVGSFVVEVDIPGGECNLIVQDCPPGLKCMPWANDGGSSWNATGCFPVVEDPDAPGEPCTVEGSGVSGLDTCERGAMCWDVDPETNDGICRAMCSGSYDEPICEDPETFCPISADGALLLCLPVCDPIAQDCEPGQGCYAVQHAFTCAPDASGEQGALGEPCEYTNGCDPGLFCAPQSVVPDCMGGFGCCSPFCDVTDETPACLPGQECVPWYGPSETPHPLHEDVGACAVP